MGALDEAEVELPITNMRMKAVYALVCVFTVMLLVINKPMFNLQHTGSVNSTYRCSRYYCNHPSQVLDQKMQPAFPYEETRDLRNVLNYTTNAHQTNGRPTTR